MNSNNQQSSVQQDNDDDRPTAAAAASSFHYHNMIAGAVAGVGARLFTAPLDLWRIRRQLFPEATRQYGMLSGMRHIVQTEGGLTSLFRGNIAATYLWMGYSAVQFSFYEWSATILNDDSSLPPMVRHFVSGAAAGTVATITTYPMDLTRTVFAAKGIHTARETLSKTPFTGSYAPKSILEFVEHILHRHGVRGLFSGCGPAVVQIIPYMGLNFCIHDYLVSWKDQKQHNNENSNKAISAVLSASAGAISGGLSKMIVFPLDTVKKRLQAQSAFGKMYSSMMDCMMTIVRTEGVRSLYNGLVPSVLKNTVATALSFGLFTLTKNSLATLETRRNETDIPPPCFIQEKVSNDSNDGSSAARANQ